jgi:hypothetical protein
MTMLPRVTGIVVLCATVILLGADGAAAQAPRRGPCAQIVAACEQAGFERGAARAGNGIQVDCVRPIMQGAAQPRRATKPLPQISPDLVAACRESNPNLGHIAIANGRTGGRTRFEADARARTRSAAGARRANIVFVLADDFSVPCRMSARCRRTA